MLGYAVWDHLPNGNQSGAGVAWGDTVKSYIPPAAIALILFSSAVLQAITARRRYSPPETASETHDAQPTIEILSPFDHDEVGLYETIRGRVFPANQELQVAVLAGDKKWYPQKPVIVRGSTWTVKCQFGRSDKTDEGSYKVVALLGNELTNEVYSELPTNIPKSNIITVHRPEVTIEQELMAARSECNGFKKQLQSATNAFTDMEEQVEALTTEKSKLERELVTIKKDKHALEQSLENSQRELSEARSDADNYQREHDGLLNDKKRLDEKLLEAQKALKEETKKANYESNQREELVKLYYESERKLGDLKWLENRMKDQAENLETWVRIKKANRVKLQLAKTPRMVVLAFWVQNESIFTITLNLNEMTGCLKFKAQSLRDPVRLPIRSSPTENLEPGALMEIILEQPLLQSEAETILDSLLNGDANAIFSLDNLNIPISVRNIAQTVKTKRLSIHGEIEHIAASDFPCDKIIVEETGIS